MASRAENVKKRTFSALLAMDDTPGLFLEQSLEILTSSSYQLLTPGSSFAFN